MYFIILISFSLSLFLSFHFVSFPFHCLVWKWMERESEEEKKRRREWKWLGRNWCTCGGICPELCRRGRRWYRRWLLGFRPRPLGGTPGKMFAVAVVVSPWPFLVLFLPLSNYFLFFVLSLIWFIFVFFLKFVVYLGMSLIVYGGWRRWLRHLTLFGCRENVTKGLGKKCFFFFKFFISIRWKWGRQFYFIFSFYCWSFGFVLFFVFSLATYSLSFKVPKLILLFSCTKF